MNTNNNNIKKTKESSEQSQQVDKRPRGLTEYGNQLFEKQKVKKMYGMKERQFRRFFSVATKLKGGTGENLLSLLERRLDNVIYKLKLAVSRTQARQIITHGHVFINGNKVTSPSYLVNISEEISLDPVSLNKENFVKQVVDKRLNIGVKVPDWLELNKKDRKGKILRLPVRSDIQTPIEEHLIVELYSK